MQYYYSGKSQRGALPIELYIRDVNFFRYNWHPECEFLLLLRGSVSLSTGGVIHPLREDDVFLISPNHGHALISEEKESTALVLRFAPEIISELEPSLKTVEIECSSTRTSRGAPRFARLRQYAAQMMLAAVSEAQGAHFLTRGAFSMLLGTLLSEFPTRPAADAESPRDRKNMKTIKTVTDWLEKNYDRKLTLEAAAKVARYNRTYFSSFFRKNVGIPFYDYLTRLRFRHALYQLNNTDKSLTDIAADCGFADLKTFSVYYKKMFHEPPSERRRVLGERGFTRAEENERIYLDTGDAALTEKLRACAQLAPSVPQPLPLIEQQNSADLARIAQLCGQIMKIAECGSKTR